MIDGLILPRFTGWMLTDEGLTEIIRLVEEHRPRLILEAGSGRSTVVLAAALRGIGRLFSLEDSQHYAVETRRLLDENDLEAGVRWAPLVMQEHGLWYAETAWHDLKGIEMLIVDGPLGASAPLARYPALPLLRDRLAADTVVVLDDTNRPDEQEILRRWDLRDVQHVQHSGRALSWGHVTR